MSTRFCPECGEWLPGDVDTIHRCSSGEKSTLVNVVVALAIILTLVVLFGVTR